MRWADTTRSSHGMPSSLEQAIDAFSRHGKSDRLPPTMPTTGRLAVVHRQSSQRSAARAARARASASSTSVPITVTWPILRRSNTRRLP